MSPEPVALLALAPDEAVRAALSPAFSLEAVAPSALALARRLRPRATRAFTAVVVEDARPDLVFLAHALGADRVAVRHRPRSQGAVRASAIRAAYAVVDLALVASASEERSAVRAGADPDRVTRATSAVAERLRVEPARRSTRPASREAVTSLALDAAELLGAVRLAELLTPDRGVNVLNYHRVLPIAEASAYGRPQMVIAEPAFEAQLDLLARCRGFTTVEQVQAHSSEGRVAITFDDGYEDNYRVAWPIMQRFGVLACIFLVTDLVGGTGALWWDRLGLALWRYWAAVERGPLPALLPPPAHALARTAAVEEARRLICEVISALNARPPPERSAALAAVEALAPDDGARRTMLTWEEVATMASAGVRFGGHTRSHVPLDELPVQAARAELSGSRDDLRAHLREPQPSVVALPRGRLGPLSEAELRGLGIDAVMTTRAGVNATRGAGALFVLRRDGRMLTLGGRHHPAKLRLELTGLFDRARAALRRTGGERGAPEPAPRRA